jgi:hypothetical protein
MPLPSAPRPLRLGKSKKVENPRQAWAISTPLAVAMVLPESSPEGSAELLRQHIIQALTQQLEHADWSALECLKNPVLRIEACLEEAPSSSRPSTAPGAIVSVSETVTPQRGRCVFSF